jgi:hypothetical protein
MKHPADHLVEASRRHGQPRGDMSTQVTVDLSVLFSRPSQTAADEAPGWASDLEFVAAESPNHLIQALHPGAKPYRPRGGENDG